jgi:large subunit ribosomal protein L29
MSSKDSFKQLDIESLDKELTDLFKEGFNLRIQKGSGQLTKTHQLRRVRRDIARIKTFKKQKQVSNHE